jgi:hypothetical protein
MRFGNVLATLVRNMSALRQVFGQNDLGQFLYGLAHRDGFTRCAEFVAICAQLAQRLAQAWECGDALWLVRRGM